MIRSYRTMTLIQNLVTYIVLSVFALFMLFPFLFMFFSSLKTPQDTFLYPPRMLPRDPVKVSLAGYDEPLRLYYVDYDGAQRQFALVEENVKIGIYVDPQQPDASYERPDRLVSPTGGFQQQSVMFDGEERLLWDIQVGEQIIPMVRIRQTAYGRFVNPDNPFEEIYQNVRLSTPVETLAVHPENYADVLRLRSLDRSLTNTALVTVLVVAGQLVTSIFGGYAFARLKFPGRDQLFLVYLGTIMVPFVVLIVPLYQLMVTIGWVDKLTALVMPWIFTAYGTFLMRQFFISVPKEIEEAALMDGASRLQILLRIFVPAAGPALATQATFTFLYAWNSFLWPLIIINTGNEKNHVITLALSILRGRAMDSPNLILAGAAICIIPPMIIYVLAQRFFIESVVSSGVKG